MQDMKIFVNNMDDSGGESESGANPHQAMRVTEQFNL
jgi:hypothetical protein